MGERKKAPVGLGHRPELDLALYMPEGITVKGGYTQARPFGSGLGNLGLELLGLADIPYPADFKLKTAFFRFGDPQYLAFKQRVLDAQIKNALKNGRVFTATLAKGTLDVVEHGQQMLKDAAAKCRELLAAAREEIDGKNAKQTSLKALSGYRTVEKEQQLWDGYYDNYYTATLEARERIPSGPHSESAVTLLALYISDRKAAPGYGNHSAGIAMDFSTTSKKVTYGASMAQKDGWKKTPFHVWLKGHAHEYDFKPYWKEPWHWEYKPPKDEAKKGAE